MSKIDQDDDKSIPPKKTRTKTDVKTLDIKRKQSNVEFLIVNSISGPSEPDGTADTDYEAFFKTLTRKEKHELRSLEHELKSLSDPSSGKPLKYRILTSAMPKEAKVLAFGRLKNFAKMTSDDHEYFKLKDWFETLLKVPFGKHITVPVTKYDKKTEISKFMTDTKSKLDSEIYGLDIAKNAFMQILAQWITNPASTSSALGFEGPPGCGKTMSLLAFAKTVERPFHLITLGGCKDSSYLMGHDFTYLGSKGGRILDSLISSRCMNPVIFFDELDKLSETSHGQEITGLLIHLIDGTQNKFIQDRYLSGVDLDLSRVLFVFSYNDVTKIDPILLDRIINVKLNGYERKDKRCIAYKHILPDAFKNVGIHPELLEFDDSCIDHIIDEYTNKEHGVRSLKRVLEHICKEFNLMTLTKCHKEKLSFRLEDFPIRLNTSDIDILIGSSLERVDKHYMSMYT